MIAGKVERRALEHRKGPGNGTYLGFNGLGTAPLQLLLPKTAAVASPSTDRRDPGNGSNARSRDRAAVKAS